MRLKNPSIKFKLLCGSFVLLLLVLLALRSVIYPLILKPVGESENVKIKLEPTSTVSDVASLLETKQVIRSSWIFVILARWQGVEGFPPGEYELRQNRSASQVLNTLRQGPKIKEYAITIPEGFTIEQIAGRISKETGVDEGEFKRLTQTSAHSENFESYSFLSENGTETLEGYLFPKTYIITEEHSAKDFIQIMLDQYQKETAGFELPPFARERNLNFHHLLTVASLIENEAKIAEERSLISAVIYNRLAKNMKLQSCATVQYALPERKANLNTEDLKVDSPYNTYLHSGLPPGPICNPGIASIKAALNPAPVNYLYYVLTESGDRHAFTDSYQEFIEEKQKAKSP